MWVVNAVFSRPLFKQICAQSLKHHSDGRLLSLLPNFLQHEVLQLINQIPFTIKCSSLSLGNMGEYFCGVLACFHIVFPGANRCSEPFPDWTIAANTRPNGKGRNGRGEKDHGLYLVPQPVVQAYSFYILYFKG